MQHRSPLSVRVLGFAHLNSSLLFNSPFGSCFVCLFLIDTCLSMLSLSSLFQLMLISVSISQYLSLSLLCQVHLFSLCFVTLFILVVRCISSTFCCLVCGYFQLCFVCLIISCIYCLCHLSRNMLRYISYCFWSWCNYASWLLCFAFCFWSVFSFHHSCIRYLSSVFSIWGL